MTTNAAPSGLAALSSASTTAANIPAINLPADTPTLSSTSTDGVDDGLAAVAQKTETEATMGKVDDNSAAAAGNASGLSDLSAMAAAAKSKTSAETSTINVAAPAASAPASRGVEASFSDSPRKRKVYDEKSGLYGDSSHESGSGHADFSASEDSAVFQMGSRSKTSIGELGRIPHRRRNSGDGSIFVPRRPLVRSKSDAATRNWANLQSDDADGCESGNGNSPEGDWIAKSTSFPPPQPDAEPFANANVARTQSQGGEPTATSNDDFMSALGWGAKEDDEDDNTPADPSVSFTMRRAQRKDSSELD